MVVHEYNLQTNEQGEVQVFSNDSKPPVVRFKLSVEEFTEGGRARLIKIESGLGDQLITSVNRPSTLAKYLRKMADILDSQPYPNS